MTAYHCLFADGPLDGRDVLVAGGAGAVGHAAIELARHAGARVIATGSSDEKAARARRGRRLVVDYRAGDAAEQIHAAAPEGVNRVVEVALPANLELDLAVCRPTRSSSSTPNRSERSHTAGSPADDRQRRLRFVLLYGIGAESLAAAVAGVSEAVAAGS